jgi:hypothetical protein
VASRALAYVSVAAGPRRSVTRRSGSPSPAPFTRDARSDPAASATPVAREDRLDFPNPGARRRRPALSWRACGGVPRACRRDRRATRPASPAAPARGSRAAMPGHPLRAVRSLPVEVARLRLNCLPPSCPPRSRPTLGPVSRGETRQATGEFRGMQRPLLRHEYHGHVSGTAHAARIRPVWNGGLRPLAHRDGNPIPRRPEEGERVRPPGYGIHPSAPPPRGPRASATRSRPPGRAPPASPRARGAARRPPGSGPSRRGAG